MGELGEVKRPTGIGPFAGAGGYCQAAFDAALW